MNTSNDTLKVTPGVSTPSWAEYLAGQSLEGYLDFLSLHGPLVREVLANSPARVVEMGCGGANLAIFFAHLGLESVGIDIDAQVVEEAKRHAASLRGNVEFVVADGFATGLPDDRFDASVSQGVLEHFSDEDIHRFLSESIRISKRTVASMPNANYPTRDFGNERLMPVEFWKERGEEALRLSGRTGKVTAFDYRRRPDLKHPLNSLLNTAFKRCYFTLLIIEGTEG